jgi:diguanylate cyclase (GGDEF)-like protein
MFRVDLRRLILWVGMASLLVALVNALYASFLVQRDMLINSTLDGNRVYALKVADLTENLLDTVRRELSNAADRLSDYELNPIKLSDTVTRLQTETGQFNSVLAMASDGTVLAMSPPTLNLVGTRVDTENSRLSLKNQVPTLSHPFQSAITKRWQITLTYPIFSQDHRYIGLIAGNIYLHEKNALNNLLGVHYYRNGAYLYVVDNRGTLIYHPQSERIGERSGPNPAIKDVMQGHNGQIRMINSRGVDMLAGYAVVASTGWGVVAQESSVSVLQQIESLLMRTVRNSLPVLLLSLLAIWWLARSIARPLQDLARIAKQMDDADSSDQIRAVRSWYFEAAQLKWALLAGLWAVNHKMHNLRQESTTDPLTGLMNRRGLANAVAELRLSKRGVAVIAIDIDRFKVINDTLGHDAGDAVLRTLARTIERTSRSLDLLARTGGEEFLMLLPDSALADAVNAAERLRLALTETAHVSGMHVTISLGVAHYPESKNDLDAVLKLADDALYQAKNRGRDRTCVADAADPSGYRTVGTHAPY